MLLDALKDFSWHNEPFNVRFSEEGMIVETLPHTDFWQNRRHNFQKDDGHFFYQNCPPVFSLDIKWHAENPENFAQCGIMIRQNEFNWAKAGILCASKDQPQIGSVVTVAGQSDWAVNPLKICPADIWYRLCCQNGDCVLSYSLDGRQYQRLRLFYLNSDNGLKAGAYACSPQESSFSCTLENISFK